MTKFEKPGSRDWDYPDMAKEAITKALADSSIPYEAVEQACAGYVYGDSTCGQRALYTVGLSGIPVYNVNNNCSTGSTALYMAYQFIKGGLNDCVLAFGFEKMEKGSLGSKFQDRTNPMDQHVNVMLDTFGFAKAPPAPQMFGNAGREHMQKYGTKPEVFAMIAEKNHRHSANNPYSQFRDVYTLEQIMKSPMVHEPLTKLQCCPTSDGAGAAVLVSEDFVNRYGLQHQAVEIAGMSMATDMKSSFDEKSMIKCVGFDLTKKAAEEVYRQAGMSAQDVQVIELHDCFSANELITYEALGLCPVGKAGDLVLQGQVTYGGKWVVNPSGGLISKGHPLGATGLAQCAELCWQIRGMAEKRQVKGATAALQHNLGLGGAAVVTLYRKPAWKNLPPRALAPKTPSRSDFIGAAPAVPPAAESAAPAASDAEGKPSSASGLQAEAVFTELAKRLSPDMVKKVGCSYRFDIDGGDKGKKSWFVDLKNGAGSITESSAKADCMIAMKDGDFVALMAGKLNAQKAFMEGKIKIKGNMMLAQKLQLLSSASPSKL